jgi:trehalose 6-phosphate phosphatase
MCKKDFNVLPMIQNAVVDLPLAAVSLFLDLDGTLAPIAATPEAVGPDIARNTRLRDLTEALDGRLAVISGRPISDIDRILEGRVVAVAGSHGLQRRDAELDILAAPSHPRLDQAFREVERFVARNPGTLAEIKPHGVALHYRNRPECAAEAEAFAADLARRTGLKLQPGSMVRELLTPGADKGAAVRAFLAEPPFAGTVPVYVGDDLTDEDGFAAAHALGGMGVLVGLPRPTAARFRLPDVAAVQFWLEASLRHGRVSLEVPVESSYRRF